MNETSLSSRNILVVEDEYILANELSWALEEEGATVLGPVATLEDALDFIRSEENIDGVLLDLNLQGKLAFAAAELLLQRSVPFLFTTGYDKSIIPGKLAHIRHCEKPVEPGDVTRLLAELIESSPEHAV